MNFKPEGYHTLTPYLIVRNAASAIDYYKTIFGAQELMRIPQDTKVGHAELKIGDSVIMLADEFPEMNILSADSIGGSPISMVIYVPNVDETIAAAVEAGAKLERPIEDKFYGDRAGSIKDPLELAGTS